MTDFALNRCAEKKALAFALVFGKYVRMTTNTLKNTIIELMEHPSNTNTTGLELCPVMGWRLTLRPEDMSEGGIMVISREALEEWADGHEWDDAQFDLAEEFITDNLGDWLSDDLDKYQRAALLSNI